VKRLLILIAILTMVSAVAFCAGYDGTWSAQGGAQGSGGPGQLVLRVSGMTLAGTIDGMVITNGSYEGNFFWFRATRAGVAYEYKGTISGEQMQLNEARGEQVRRMVFRRTAN